jgi:hypothetical protein
MTLLTEAAICIVSHPAIGPASAFCRVAAAEERYNISFQMHGIKKRRTAC